MLQMVGSFSFSYFRCMTMRFEERVCNCKILLLLLFLTIHIYIVHIHIYTIVDGHSIHAMQTISHVWYNLKCNMKR